MKLLAAFLVTISAWAANGVYSGITLSQNGVGFQASVQVFIGNTNLTTKAPNLYRDINGTMGLGNPFQSAPNGSYTFFAPPGQYDVQISGPGVTLYTVSILIIAPSVDSGVKPNITGCGTISNQIGGSTVGTFVTSAVSCTPSLTALPFGTNGHTCLMWDQTHYTTPIGNTSSTTTSASFPTFVTTVNDTITFNCGLAY